MKLNFNKKTEMLMNRHDVEIKSIEKKIIEEKDTYEIKYTVHQKEKYKISRQPYFFINALLNELEDKKMRKKWMSGEDIVLTYVQYSYQDTFRLKGEFLEYYNKKIPIHRCVDLYNLSLSKDIKVNCKDGVWMRDSDLNLYEDIFITRINNNLISLKKGNIIGSPPHLMNHIKSSIIGILDRKFIHPITMSDFSLSSHKNRFAFNNGKILATPNYK